MKIILQREVEKLGVPGDVVDVADGYARNYLVPRGMAIPATRGAVKHAGRLRQSHDTRVQKEVGSAESLAATLTETPIRIPARAGEDGRLFGSITIPHLAEALSKAIGIPIDRRQVHLAEPIRSTGTHEVDVSLHPEVTAKVTVEVVSQR
jgi:large subunit ribosomal protein L9